MSRLTNRLLLLAAAVSAGYLLTTAWFHFFPPSLTHAAPHDFSPTGTLAPEVLLDSQSAGVEIPWEVRSRMLGKPAQKRPDAEESPAGSTPKQPPNFAFIIGAHQYDQIDERKQMLRSEAGSKQENGETEASLDTMIREGRMAW